MASTIQKFDGKVATTGDEVVIKWTGTLYPGEVTSIHTGTDTPNITLTPDDDQLGELSGLTFVDVPAVLRESQPNGSWFWKTPPPPPSVVKEKRKKLVADASAIGTTWTDVLVETLGTEGDSIVEIEASCQAGVLVGGSMRVVIDGGSFDDLVLATSSLPLLAGNAPGPLKTYADLPASAQVYTVKIQAQAALGGSVTPRAGSALFLTEKR